MQTRLGQYADKAIEFGWLAVVIFAPLFFNVYSSRVFEPDKISVVRTFVLLMLVAWIIKLGEAGWRGWRESQQDTGNGAGRGRVGNAASYVVESASPSWLGVLRVPMVLAILVYALAYFISSIFSITPDATWWGSYQRGQGTYSQYSYMMLGILVLANLRTRPQLDRLLNFMLLTSLPVALYGVMQAMRIDPLPWAGDTSTRVASTMGNAIFVAAWLIMVVPFAIYKLMMGLSASLEARNANVDDVEVVQDGARGRTTRRTRQAEPPSHGWAVVANCVGVVMASLMLFYLTLKMTAGLPYPDGRMWFLYPLALLVFGGAGWFIECAGRRQDDPAQSSTILPIVGTALFVISFLALTIEWALADNSLELQLDFNGSGVLWTFFFVLAWASLAAGLYVLATRERDEGYADTSRGIVPASLNFAYGALIVLQLVCIALTQSRGPWLGLGAGLVTFMIAMWLIGRSHRVSWMTRIGGVASALVLVLVLFVALLNVAGPSFTAFNNLPIVGRSIERLSTLTRTEDGTGRVRSLIWQGATDLIVSDPVRSVVGWGPESMYVAYNRFYPAELSQVELRNATPDRSHNVEFDQLVTMGALGLLTYYILVGAFFFFTLRIIKRAANTRDQLFGVAMLAAVVSHFIEIQTGIQIVSTWSYFYLIAGMMVAFGYYMNTYLRPQASASYMDEIAPAVSDRTRPSNAALYEADDADTLAAGVGAGVRATATMQATGGNGKSQGQVQQARRSGSAPALSGQSRNQPISGGRGGGTGKGSRATAQYSAPRGTSASQWVRNPVMLALYGVVALIALVIIWTVNVANVQADTLFKQAQVYDSGGRYLGETDPSTGLFYPGSTTFYERALDLQPNQDYFYLFLGRAYLQSAKAVAQEPYNRRLGVAWSEDTQAAQQEKKVEELARLELARQKLETANKLSPYNTDHYANLGRMYLYWADQSSGYGDVSKAPLAVQWMEQAVEHTPENAQLRNELAVAYTLNNRFSDAIASLLFSRDLDPLYASTPMIRGQLYQQRASEIRNNLILGLPLPTDGETDYGKLVVEAGKAFSQTIETDPSVLMDAAYGARIDFFIEATRPFTNTNSSLTESVLSNVLTDTLILGFNNDIARQEADLANRVRGRGVSVLGDIVESTVLAGLWSSGGWAQQNADGSGDWIADEIRLPATRAAMGHYGLGFIWQTLGDKAAAITEYNRALALRPNYTEAITALQIAQQTPTPEPSPEPEPTPSPTP